MIIVKLEGGLGNQMFQYAAGRALAEWHRVPLKLDISEFKNNPLRYYQLNQLSINGTTATDEEAKRIQGKNLPGILYKAFARVQSSKPYYNRRIFQEQHFHYDPNILKANKKTYLSGYWQSEKYFKPYETTIRKEFSFIKEAEGKNPEFAKIIADNCSVSVHVRRRDYITNPITSQFHGVCGSDYYKKAVELMTQKLNNPYFFVFSDDLDWVKKNIILNNPVEYVEHNLEQNNHYEDMRLMSLCKNNIIANSSFSWWGAWLNNNPGKIVIAPDNWFDKSSKWYREWEIQTKDVIPGNWIKL